MGLGIPVVTLLDRLFHDGVLPRTGSVIEVGSQDLYLKGFGQALETFGQRFGVSLGPLADPVHSRSGARTLFESIGWTYTSVDLDDDHGAVRIDLNYESAPAGVTYDLVTNLGTTEHILNQANCFRVIHDLTSVGGVMIHLVPFMGYLDHGFFSYHPNLFHALAGGNQYELLGTYYNPSRKSAALMPWAPDLLSYLTLTPDTGGALIVVMRKTVDAPFAIPQQGRYGTLRPSVPLDGRDLNGGMTAHEIELEQAKTARRAERRAARDADRRQSADRRADSPTAPAGD